MITATQTNVAVIGTLAIVFGALFTILGLIDSTSIIIPLVMLGLGAITVFIVSKTV